jgi:diaminobutyrate-2-oxoglutarate transaminase
MVGQLQGLAAEHPCIGDVRGRGLMIGVELVGVGAAQDADRPAAPDASPHPPAPELAASVQRECLRRGLIVELGGRHSSVVRLLPPLTITDEQAAAVVERLADALAEAARTHRG